MMNTKIKQLFSVVVTSALTVTLGMAQTIEQGLSELNAERVKEAGEVFSKVVESDANADNLFYQGYFFLKTNQLDKAEESFNKGVQADGKNVLNNIGLGAVALGKGDLAKANELIDGAVKKKMLRFFSGLEKPTRYLRKITIPKKQLIC
jgi:tetratricopeptide (TPR) repeat protein